MLSCRKWIVTLVIPFYSLSSVKIEWSFSILCPYWCTWGIRRTPRGAHRSTDWLSGKMPNAPDGMFLNFQGQCFYNAPKNNSYKTTNLGTKKEEGSHGWRLIWIPILLLQATNLAQICRDLPTSKPSGVFWSLSSSLSMQYLILFTIPSFRKCPLLASIMPGSLASCTFPASFSISFSVTNVLEHFWSVLFPNVSSFGHLPSFSHPGNLHFISTYYMLSIQKYICLDLTFA